MNQRLISIREGRKTLEKMRYYHIIACSFYGIVAVPLLIRAYVSLGQQKKYLMLGIQFILAIACLIAGLYHMNKECNLFQCSKTMQTN